MTSDPDDLELPRGMAQERTDLARNRTGLSLLVCIAVLLRRLWPLGRTGSVVAMACVAAAAVVWAIALRPRRPRSVVPGIDGTPMGRKSLYLISVGTFLLAVAGFVLGLFPGP